MLLLWDCFAVTKPLSQIQKSTLWPLQDANPTPSLGGFGFTGIVYAREVAGAELTFGVSGALIMNALVMYDLETDSFWSQFLGKAVDGHYAGTDLEMVPSQLTSWGAWKEQHPDTLALDRGFTGPSSDAYISYYNSQGAGILGESNFDVRLPTKSLVVGLVGETSQMAYPAGLMLATEVVNDTLEDTPLVVFANRESSAITVFRRTVDRTTLTFEQRSEPNLVTDTESGVRLGQEHRARRRR